MMKAFSTDRTLGRKARVQDVEVILREHGYRECEIVGASVHRCSPLAPTAIKVACRQSSGYLS